MRFADGEMGGMGEEWQTTHGRRHPRIHHKDLLAIRMPVPDQDVQEKIVAGIRKREDASRKLRGEIEKPRSQIDGIVFEARA